MQAAIPNATPREFEANLLLTAAAHLRAAQTREVRGELEDALAHNRELWAIFLASTANADNPLPVEIRQNVATLGLFVIRQTLAILSDPRPERLNSLISINCELAAGLCGRA
jgi:flagellar protein FlaF